MDQTLLAHVKLDIVSDVVRIDVRGSLTQDTRPALMRTIQRVRRMGITSHITISLGRAAFVESSALAGLRNDLTIFDGGLAHAGVAVALPAVGGVCLELSPHRDGPATVLPSLNISGDLTASIDASGTRPLSGYSDDELLAASDSVFGLLDDPADMASSELLAAYDDIGLEITRREVGGEPDPA